MARFACIRAEAEKRRAEVVMARGGNDKIRILDIRYDEQWLTGTVTHAGPFTVL